MTGVDDVVVVVLVVVVTSTSTGCGVWMDGISTWRVGGLLLLPVWVQDLRRALTAPARRGRGPGGRREFGRGRAWTVCERSADRSVEGMISGRLGGASRLTLTASEAIVGGDACSGWMFCISWLSGLAVANIPVQHNREKRKGSRVRRS